MILLTGGAGFIGTNVMKYLNEEGLQDILLVDNIGHSDKWENTLDCRFMAYSHKDEFFSEIEKYQSKLRAVIHLGACSSTTEKDFDYLIRNNLSYSQKLWTISAECQIPFVYASSAATYGDGSVGFSDCHSSLSHLKPLNRYGLSKHLFDIWALEQKKAPPVWVGFKYFNVYGPYEFHKGRMASMVLHGYRQILSTGKIELFASDKENCQDGDQIRDFIYSRDVARMTVFPLQHKVESGIYNIGTGTGRTFNELSLSLFEAMGRSPCIDYIPMPNDLRSKYQYYTEANTKKISESAFASAFSEVKPIEEGVKEYVHFMDNHQSLS